MKPVPCIVVLDTCVLISNVLRQGLLDLARQGCFVPAWSRIIGDEWVRNAARLWEIDVSEVQTQWDALQAAWPAADLGDVAAYKQGLERSDPKDWHVVAAARKALAQCAAPTRVAVVTRNIRDFHRAELYHLGLELLDPDQLMVRCLEHHPERIAAMLARVPGYAMEYGRPREALGDILRRERLFRLNKLWETMRPPLREPAESPLTESPLTELPLTGAPLIESRPSGLAGGDKEEGWP